MWDINRQTRYFFSISYAFSWQSWETAIQVKLSKSGKYCHSHSFLWKAPVIAYAVRLLSSFAYQISLINFMLLIFLFSIRNILSFKDKTFFNQLDVVFVNVIRVCLWRLSYSVKISEKLCLASKNLMTVP